MFDFRDGDFSRSCHHGIEIPRGFAEHQIAFSITLPGADERQIGFQRPLQQIKLPIELFGLFTLGDRCAHTRARIKSRDTGTTGADALGQRALRVEFDLDFALEILLLEKAVFADIGADHFFDLSRLQQNAEPIIVHSGIVRDDGEVAHAGRMDGADQIRWNAAQSETAGHDGHAIGQQPGERSLRVPENFRHAPRILPGRAREQAVLQRFAFQ